MPPGSGREFAQYSATLCVPETLSIGDPLTGLVNEANGLGMVAIMTLQERNQTGQAGPTSSSTTFWQWMAGHYAANPMVMFDQ